MLFRSLVQLDKANQFAALAATVAVKEIFAGVVIPAPRSGLWEPAQHKDATSGQKRGRGQAPRNTRGLGRLPAGEGARI